MSTNHEDFRVELQVIRNNEVTQSLAMPIEEYSVEYAKDEDGKLVIRYEFRPKD